MPTHPTTPSRGSSIAGRLGASFAALIVLILAVAGLNAVTMVRMGEQLQRIVEVNNRKSELASQLLNGINAMVIQANTISLVTDSKDIEGEVAALREAEARHARAEDDLKRLMASTRSAPQELALMADIERLSAQTLPFIRQAAAEGQRGANIESTSTLTKEVRPRATAWRAKMGDLVGMQQRLNAEAAAQAMDGRRSALLGALGLVALAVLCGVLLAWRIVRSIRRPIDQAIVLAQQIAQGDLTSEARASSSLSEIGRLMDALGAMQERLRLLVGEIRTSAESMNAASAEVAVGNQDLSQRTELAAASVQSTASSMMQISGSIHDTADAAGAANRLAIDASEQARDGGTLVDNVVQTMGAITSCSRRIFETIGVIDAIALRTNILALNAAVEAARAGDKGQGFAVVAQEVRSLAQRAAGAAKDVKVLVEQSITSLDQGTRLVGSAGQSMERIVRSVSNVCDEIGKISAASASQSREIAQINQAVTRLDAMTQQNAALVEESAAAAAHLQSQSQRLAALVSTFRTAQGHEGGEESLPPPDSGMGDAAPAPHPPIYLH